MSLLDTASLIVTPNGYKEGKLYSVIPSDGSGDLSVTRATTATRVNSAGLVELVPYNLFTYSEQFDNADWSKSSGTITANATTAPNGTTTADLYTANGSLSNHDFFEGFTGGSQTTASIYVKKNTAQYVYISLNYQISGVNWATGIYDLDALTTATFQSGGVTSQVATISDEGNGWRRITLKVDTANTDLYCMYGVADSMSPTLGSRGRVENSSSASFYAWGAQLVEGSVAKDYQKTETRLNIPRLDYSNGTCPSILVEPQRTNEASYSEQFDNSWWTKYEATVTANNTTAPNGTTSADKLTDNTANDGHFFYRVLTISSALTMSVYAKAAEYTKVAIRNLSDGGDVIFDLSNGTIVSTPSNFTNAQIESVGNGWYRISATTNGTSGTKAMGYSLVNNSNQTTFVGTGTSSAYFWGAQFEVGSYATSYIPTTSASVTRNADVISKTGATSLIGQTEGTLFLDLYFELKQQSNFLIQLTDGTNDFIELYIAGGIMYFSGYNGASQWTISTSLTDARHKIAYAYKANDIALYVDGVLIGTDTSAAIPTCNNLYLNQDLFGQYNQQQYYNAAALWKTRLTNAQLATLTTI